VDVREQGLPPRFDPLDPAVRADPYPAYARLREAGRLCRGGPGQWVVTRHADVAALLTDPRLGNRFPEEYHRLSAGCGPAAEFLARIVLHRDRPEHSRLRRLIGGAFSPRLLGGLRGRIRQLADVLLDPAVETGLLDAVDDLAFPLPGLVVCELLGIPAHDRRAIPARASALGRVFATVVDDRGRAVADEAVVWLREYLARLLDDRKRRPTGDLLSRMAAVERGGDRLSRDEIVDNAAFLLFAGFETTASLIGTGCAALLDHPGELARLRADRSLIPLAVEEFLRYDAPIQSRLRVVLDPIDVGGRTVKPGRLLLLLLGSANRDERRFARPEELDVGRHPNPHVSFGGGVHFCAGAALARMEGAIVFDRLLERFSRLEPAGEPVRDVGRAFRAFSHVPIAVEASRT
jgi:cytochrome P450